MRCNIYREKIIENPYTMPPQIKIHIEDCYECKRLHNDCLKFEKFMGITKRNLLQNTQTTIQPQHLLSLAFVKKAVQKNLATMKRLYVYATIILIAFIYALLLNSFTYVKYNTPIVNNITYTQDMQYIVDKEDTQFFEELAREDNESVSDTISFIDSYL